MVINFVYISVSCKKTHKNSNHYFCCLQYKSKNQPICVTTQYKLNMKIFNKNSLRFDSLLPRHGSILKYFHLCNCKCRMIHKKTPRYEEKFQSHFYFIKTRKLSDYRLLSICATRTPYNSYFFTVTFGLAANIPDYSVPPGLIKLYLIN